MNQKPLVSIITPSFNQAQFLEETILSVINQSYPNIEYIIIDGGSTDGSIDVIKKYNEYIKYWVSEKDKGQADAINKGYAKANGDYICWINSDDLLHDDFVQRRMNEFREYPGISMIYGDIEQGSSVEKKVIRKGEITNYRKMIISSNVPVPQQSAIWKREVIVKSSFLDERWHLILDWEFFIRISKNHKIFYCPGAVGFFRNHNQSKSISLRTEWVQELELFYNEYKFDEEFSKFEIQHIFANYHIRCSQIFKEADLLNESKKYLIKAFSTSPIWFFYYYIELFFKKLINKVYGLFSLQ